MTQQASAETQGQTSGATGEAQQSAAGSQQGGSGAQGGAADLARPDWAPESLWDAKAGFKAQDAATQLKTLSEFKATVDAKAAAVPAKPDAYELKLPADAKLPDGYEFQFNADDPMTRIGREIAHKAGLDQSGFEQMVGMYAQLKASEAKELQTLAGKQIEALGAKGADRKAAVETWLTAKIGPNALPLFGGALMTKAGIEALEAIQRDNASGGMAGFTQGGREAGGKATISEEEYARMSPAERLDNARKAKSGAR